MVDLIHLLVIVKILLYFRFDFNIGLTQYREATKLMKVIVDTKTREIVTAYPMSEINVENYESKNNQYKCIFHWLKFSCIILFILSIVFI